MEQLAFIILILLLLGLPASILGRTYFKGRLLIYRNLVTIVALAFYGYWLVKQSLLQPTGEGLAIQIVNKHPQTLDFYSIEVGEDERQQAVYHVEHWGNIRPEHYRVAYLPMKQSDEFWLVGFSGKTLAYYTQHMVLNKNEDRYIEANHYLNQSTKLSTIAKRQIDLHKQENNRHAVVVIFSFLIILINMILFFRHKK
ncbi:hypothetical protein [Riemerella columbina]|uniref:hypothetical protein n=1 Tax=Riemerella columbina TaxID=103810 RepID=UPI00266F13E5|nr:hypothetical protein [Riemerella columbina]WKS95826.1 hypothetical protein NYR17_03570 [Riemerella columbina]